MKRYIKPAVWLILLIAIVLSVSIYSVRYARLAKLVSPGWHDYPAEIVTPVKVYCARNYEVREFSGPNACGDVKVILFTDEVGDIVMSDCFQVTRLDD